MAPPTKTCIMTGSGRYFDPMNPTPESVYMPDVARGLKNIRFNNQVRDLADCPDPRSIASHSMRVARMVWWRLDDAVKGGTVDTNTAVINVLAALIHDAGEGYCQDRARPLKTDRDREIEAKVLECIAEHLVGCVTKILLVDTIDSAAVRWADELALSQEALLFQCGAEDWAAWPRATEVAATLHLFWPREGEDWELAVTSVANWVRGGRLMAWDHVAAAIGIGQP